MYDVIVFRVHDIMSVTKDNIAFTVTDGAEVVSVVAVDLKTLKVYSGKKNMAGLVYSAAEYGQAVIDALAADAPTTMPAAVPTNNATSVAMLVAPYCDLEGLTNLLSSFKEAPRLTDYISERVSLSTLGEYTSTIVDTSASVSTSTTSATAASSRADITTNTCKFYVSTETINMQLVLISLGERVESSLWLSYDQAATVVELRKALAVTREKLEFERQNPRLWELLQKYPVVGSIGINGNNVYIGWCVHYVFKGNKSELFDVLKQVNPQSLNSIGAVPGTAAAHMAEFIEKYGNVWSRLEVITMDYVGKFVKELIKLPALVQVDIRARPAASYTIRQACGREILYTGPDTIVEFIPRGSLTRL